MGSHVGDFVQCGAEQLLHQLAVEPEHSVSVPHPAAFVVFHRLFYLPEGRRNELEMLHYLQSCRQVALLKAPEAMLHRRTLVSAYNFSVRWH